MNELLLLSKEFISKEQFENEISIKNHHIELGGDNDQLWIINNLNENCVAIINLLFLDNSSKVINDEIDYELYKNSNAPYEGYLYSIEYDNVSIIDKVIHALNTTSRNIYVEYNGSNNFIKVK
mgnify:FL=1